MAFRVDNNDEPFVQIGGGFFVNPDEERGIPLPYTVIDEEGDPVRVLFQWRYEDDPDFVDLGTTDPDELAMLIDDPAFVSEKRICTPFPAIARGHAFPVDATHVRLPELVQGESRVLASGLEFRDLQLLRPFSEPKRLAVTWDDNPLNAPIAALPLGDGRTALVLDADGTNASRLLEVNLATGAVGVVASNFMGAPTAMALEADESSALVATDLGGSWQLLRVDLESGAVRVLLSADAMRPLGPLRSVVSLGSGAALATAEDALWRLDWIDPANPRTPQ